MRLGVLLGLVVLCGCTTVQIPNYIKADHPYTCKVYGNFDKIASNVRAVLMRNGFKIDSETNPSVFERPEAESQSDGKDVLIFTSIRQHSMFLYSSYTHLNVFIHAIAEGAEVEIRYGKVTPLVIKQFRSSRNDKLA